MRETHHTALTIGVFVFASSCVVPARAQSDANAQMLIDRQCKGPECDACRWHQRCLKKDFGTVLPGSSWMTLHRFGCTRKGRV